MRMLVTTVALFVLLAALGGCGSSQTVDARATTTGQELQDLEEAYNKGLLTEQEYQKKRQEIMNR